MRSQLLEEVLVVRFALKAKTSLDNVLNTRRHYTHMAPFYLNGGHSGAPMYASMLCGQSQSSHLRNMRPKLTMGDSRFLKTFAQRDVCRRKASFYGSQPRKRSRLFASKSTRSSASATEQGQHALDWQYYLTRMERRCVLLCL